MEVCFKRDPAGGLCSCMGPPPDSLPPPPNFKGIENDNGKALFWILVIFVALLFLAKGSIAYSENVNNTRVEPSRYSTDTNSDGKLSGEMDGHDDAGDDLGQEIASYNGDGQVDKASETGKGKDSPKENYGTSLTPDPGDQSHERENPTPEKGVNETSNADGEERTTNQCDNLTLPSEQ